VSSKISNPQIEGAFKAASLGATLIGCQSCNTSILFVYNDIHEETSQLPRSISNHIGISVIGMGVDSVYIADKAFEEVLEYNFIYNTELPLSRLASSLSTMIHKRTLSTFLRPFGIKTMLIGYDTKVGPQLIEIDPMGSLHRCKVTFGGHLASELFSKWNGYDPTDVSLQEALVRCIETLQQVFSVSGVRFDAKCLALAVVGRNLSMTVMEGSEIDSILTTSSSLEDAANQISQTLVRKSLSASI
jgi:20S proteasome alpha/beta subunit